MLRAFIILCACFYFSAHAQQLNTKELDTTDNRHHYTLDVMRVVQGTFQFGREFYFAQNKSLKTSILFTWATSKGLAKPYLSAQKFTYEKRDTLWNLNETELLGGGLNFQWREYFTRGNIDKMQKRLGAYAGPELFFRFCKVSAYGSYFDSSTNTQIQYIDSYGIPQIINRNLFLGFIGYSVGYQKALINDNLLLDLYVSGGFFFSKYDDDNGLTQGRRSPMVDYTGPYLNVGIGLGYQF